MNNSIYFLLILFNKNYNKHFLKRYVKLASFYKQRNFKKAKGLHHHHIIPDSFDGAKSNENMVYITPREHFILHWMLYKAFPKSSMVTAFKSMCSGFGKMDFRVTSKVYENLMLEFIERQRETGRKNSKKRVAEGTHNFLDGEITRQNNLRRIADGTHNFLGGEIARQMAKKKVADGTHNFLGGEIQRESNKKRLENGTHHFLGKTNPVYNQIKKLCSYCNKQFCPGMFSRWHGDKCKLNPNKF